MLLLFTDAFTVDAAKLPLQVRRSIEVLEKTTASCTGFLMNLCISYGSRAEIVNVCKDIASDVVKGTLSVDDIDETLVGRRMMTGKLPGIVECPDYFV